MDCRFDDVKIAFEYRDNKGLQLSRLIYKAINSPFITRTGILLTRAAFWLGLPLKAVFRNTLFKQFCGGTSLQEACRTAEMLRRYHVNTILDYGVERKSADADFEKTFLGLTKAVTYASENQVPFISIKVTGLARFALLEKLHRGIELSRQEQKSWELVTDRMNAICSLAADLGVMVLIDAEETWIQNAVNLVTDEMMLKYNKQKAVVYNTFQLYCKETLPFLKAAHKIAKADGYVLGAKLVRGAYMEKERDRASRHDYPSPIQKDKVHTDHDFDAAVAYCLEHINEIAVFVGTHNEKSCQRAMSAMTDLAIPTDHPHVYFSQLYGMSDHISFNMAHSGYRVAKYLPYGPVQEVIPYLLRRAEENTSVTGQSSRELCLIETEIRRRNQVPSLC